MAVWLLSAFSARIFSHRSGCGCIEFTQIWDWRLNPFLYSQCHNSGSAEMDFESLESHMRASSCSKLTKVKFGIEFDAARSESTSTFQHTNRIGQLIHSVINFLGVVRSEKTADGHIH